MLTRDRYSKRHRAEVAEDLPENLWDRLLPQREITLNLLRQSNATPNVSAYAHLSGPFDYNKMPLAPMGCAAQIHEKSDKRGTWQYHSADLRNQGLIHDLGVRKTLSTGSQGMVCAITRFGLDIATGCYD